MNNNYSELAKQYQEKYDLIDFPEAGFEIARLKELVIEHTGIPVGISKINGKVKVIHNYPKRGVVMDWADIYSQGKAVHFTDRKPVDRAQSTCRAFSLYEQGYDYSLFDNCQHCTYYCLTGEGKSGALDRTLNGMMIGGALAWLLGEMTDSKALSNIGKISLGGSIGGKVIQHFVQEAKATERKLKFQYAIESINGRFQIKPLFLFDPSKFKSKLTLNAEILNNLS